jgi:hypothetical protein
MPNDRATRRDGAFDGLVSEVIFSWEWLQRLSTGTVPTGTDYPSGCTFRPTIRTNRITEPKKRHRPLVAAVSQVLSG